ncbi:MAG: hypothetical protein ACK4XK_01995 [Casimicrobiaceae bacterium]
MKTLNLALALLAAALAGALGWLTDWGQALHRPVDLPAKSVPKADVGGLLPDFRIAADASAYGAISERPLLNPTRRPAPTAPIAAAPEPPKPQIRRGLYQLVGILDFGADRVAQVKEIATNRIRSVRVGDMLQELKVESIGTDSVRLVFAGEADVLTLPKFTASGRVPQPPAPAAPPRPVPAPQAAAAPPAAPAAQARPASPAPAPQSASAPAAPAQSGFAPPASNMTAAGSGSGAAQSNTQHPNREWARMRALRAGVQP